jgi:hypothetical protein
MDPVGCILFIGAVCCLLLALQWGGQTKPWDSPTVIGLLVTSVVLAAIFILVQLKLKEAALIPLDVFSRRSIWTGALALYSLGSMTYLVSTPSARQQAFLSVVLECFLPAFLFSSSTWD